MARIIDRAGIGRTVLAGAGALALAGLMVSGAVEAQQPPQKAPAQSKSAPAAKGQPQAAAAQSAWVKLCEQAQFNKLGADGKPMIGADGKPAIEEKSLCLTHHERIDGGSGIVMVSAAIQQLEGVDKRGIMVMLPPIAGIALVPGAKLQVFTPDMWKKVQAKEKIDEKQVKMYDLRFTVCHQAGCTAEGEAPNELIDAMTKGAMMVALVLNPEGRPYPVEIPLVGFEAAHKGPPVDNKEYSQAREGLFKQIRTGQQQRIKEYLDQQGQGGGAQAGGPAPAPAAGAKAPPPPAQKK